MIIVFLRKNLHVFLFFFRSIVIPSLKEVIARNSNVVNTNCIQIEILDN